MQGRLLPKMREWMLRLPLEESRKQSLLETLCLVHLPRCLQRCSGNERSVLREAGRKMTARMPPESAGLVECRVPGCLDFCPSLSQKMRLADPTQLRGPALHNCGGFSRAVAAERTQPMHEHLG